MSETPMVSPRHFKVKAAADAFIADYLKMEKHEAEKNRKADFCFCASAMASHADAEALRTMVDWLNWIFYFDEGQLDRDPVAAEKEIRHTFAVLEGGAETPDREQYPMRYLFRNIWDRVKKAGLPKELLYGALLSASVYRGLLLMFKRSSRSRISDNWMVFYTRWRRHAMEMVNLERRRTTSECGGGLLVDIHASVSLPEVNDALDSYAHNVNLPQEAFEHTSVQECIAVGCELAWIHNDIVSYKKDVKSGIEHNIVTVLKKNGFTTQQAMDRAGELQDECYRRWYLALTSMPVWGEATDREVLRYIEACHSFPLGDLLWSFQTDRDLGATEGYKLHETKVLDLSDLEPIAA
ncbi:(+)-eremophilene synthase [Fusarium odoratissimum]